MSRLISQTLLKEYSTKHYFVILFNADIEYMYGGLIACVKSNQGLTRYFPCHMEHARYTVERNYRNALFITYSVLRLIAYDVTGCASTAIVLQKGEYDQEIPQYFTTDQPLAP